MKKISRLSRALPSSAQHFFCSSAFSQQLKSVWDICTCTAREVGLGVYTCAVREVGPSWAYPSASSYADSSRLPGTGFMEHGSRNAHIIGSKLP